MNENVKVVFGLIGGLALFLYGMNSMSDALQKAAGEKMKKILEFLTKNPIMGALAGALVTAVLQSSSATTVMVIGFVSAGLMSLPQAISVIFGANIGTTMTAQLMAFKISDYIYPLIFIGFMLNFLGKKEKVKKTKEEKQVEKQLGTEVLEKIEVNNTKNEGEVAMYDDEQPKKKSKSKKYVDLSLDNLYDDSESKICSNCVEKNRKDALTCFKCGTKIGEE